MNQTGIDQANERLTRIREAVVLLEKSQREWDVVTGKRAWEAFLIAAGGIYSKLGEGARGNGRAEAWIGRIRHERKTDELLAYIHHARDCEEHSLEVSAEPLMEQTAVSAHPESIVEGGVIYIPASLPTGTAFATIYPPGLRLVTVRDSRFGDIFHAPTQHLRNRFEGRIPLLVAKAALIYFEALIKEATKFCSDSSLSYSIAT